MKKILVTLLILTMAYTASAQNPVIVNRAGQANTVQDARLAAQRNFLLPRFNDTTAANLDLGLDSIGALIFTRTDNKVWKRQSSPKKWTEIVSGGSGAASGISEIMAGSGLEKVNDSTLRLADSVRDNLATTFATKLNIADSAGHWVGSIERKTDSLIVYEGATRTAYYVPSSGGSGGSSDTISNYNTAYVDTLGNNATAAINNPAKPFSTIGVAMTALPASGGIIMVGNGTFATPDSIYKNNITIQGSGAPVPNWTISQASLTSVTYTRPTALIGNGTIIKGGINITNKDNIKIKDLGIDRGSAYVSGGGTEGNGIAFGMSGTDNVANTPAPPYPLMNGVDISNVVVLLKDSASLFHAIVLEDCYAPNVENILLVNGIYGGAFKTVSGHYSNITTHNNGTGVIFKSNDYSIAANNEINGFWSVNADGKGLEISNTSNTSMIGMKINNAHSVDGQYGLVFTNTFSGGFSGTSITNSTFTGSSAGINDITKFDYASATVNGVATVRQGTTTIYGTATLGGTVSGTGNWNTTGTIGATGTITGGNLTTAGTATVSTLNAGAAITVQTATTSTPLTAYNTAGNGQAYLNLKNNLGGYGAWLSIYGSTYGTVALRSALAIQNLMTGGILYQATNAAGDHIFQTTASNTERARILSNGNIGAGVAAPTSILHTTSFATAYTATATSLTATIAHNVINVTATGQTITLPTAVGVTGRQYTIKLTASGTGDVATTSSETIDGSTTYSLSAQYKYVTVQSTGSAWIIIANN